MAATMNAEDREIVEKLVKLQHMYYQIGTLRSLLPEKLINPARVALENPGLYEPEKLATYLQTAARAGRNDLEKFKQNWHSEDVRELWQAVHANDLPQGGDAWTYDYGGHLMDIASRGQTPAAIQGGSREFQPQDDADLVEVVGDFATRHPDLKVHMSAPGSALPLDIVVAQMDFRIVNSRPPTPARYSVVGPTNSPASTLRDSVLQSVSVANKGLALVELLEMLASYHDIMTRPCVVCGKNFDKTLELPISRQRSTLQDDSKDQWMAVHRDCR